MKKIARNFVLRILSSLARRRISNAVEIIGITGSVGKTTTKEAVAQILKTNFQTRANVKSFNSEFGVPLTILEEESGFSNPFTWIGILLRSYKKSFSKFPAEKLVLEMGTDKPGDFKKLLGIVCPQIGVFLNVKPVHLGANQFSSLEKIAHEKSLLITGLPQKGQAILNADDPLVAQTKTQARKILFGFTPSADLQASEISETLSGLQAKIQWKNKTAKLQVPILGKHNLGSLLAAIAVGLANELHLDDCVKSLANFHLPPGRLNLLEGIAGSKIIDGSYNSNPASVTAALSTLRKLKTAGRKIAILGQMNELGKNSQKWHHEVGVQAAKSADEIWGVFGDAQEIVDAAKQNGKTAEFFKTVEDATKSLQNRIMAEDLILVKGSQNNVRLEKLVAKILANSNDQKFLCRQDKFWQQN